MTACSRVVSPPNLRIARSSTATRSTTAHVQHAGQVSSQVNFAPSMRHACAFHQIAVSSQLQASHHLDGALSFGAWLTTTSTGVGSKPAAGLCCCGQFEMTTMTGISARSVT